MKILVISTGKSKLIPFLKAFILVSIVVSIGFGYMYSKKDVLVQKKIIEKVPMSNISFEINKITNILNSINILDMKLENNDIYIKVTKEANIQPIIARYEDMLEVKYEEDYNILKIRKLEIKEDFTKKEQLLDYLKSSDNLYK